MRLLPGQLVTIQQIKIQLRHLNKPIKEIADMFNVSNQSFFGKYVKKHLSVSPPTTDTCRKSNFQTLPFPNWGV
ncbi:MAG: hypothetical protein J6C87_04460 [Bacteroides sp.]|nr:hypothetical protein [Bacteroides sp.]